MWYTKITEFRITVNTEEMNVERDYGKEIDLLREELAEIKQLLTASAPNPIVPTHERVGHIEKMRQMHPDPAIMTLMDRMENACGEDGSTGRVTYLGVFGSGGRQSSWIKNDLCTDELLKLVEDSTAERVLACIGSNERLRLLLAILRKPRTVAQLVGECGFSSTGQVYHHLKPLIAANLVSEDAQNEGKGVYVIVPHRVQGIIMLLAGINDLLDTTYTEGEWTP